MRNLHGRVSMHSEMARAPPQLGTHPSITCEGLQPVLHPSRLQTLAEVSEVRSQLQRPIPARGCWEVSAETLCFRGLIPQHGHHINHSPSQ